MIQNLSEKATVHAGELATQLTALEVMPFTDVNEQSLLLMVGVRLAWFFLEKKVFKRKKRKQASN